MKFKKNDMNALHIQKKKYVKTAFSANNTGITDIHMQETEPWSVLCTNTQKFTEKWMILM